MTTTDTSDPLPPILVTIMDDALESDVTVAPAGHVRVMVINRGERPHGLVIARAGGEALFVAAEVPEVEPGGGGEAEADLEPGTYVVYANAEGDRARGLRVEITVQPSETYMGRRDQAASA